MRDGHASHLYRWRAIAFDGGWGGQGVFFRGVEGFPCPNESPIGIGMWAALIGLNGLFKKGDRMKAGEGCVKECGSIVSGRGKLVWI